MLLQGWLVKESAHNTLARLSLDKKRRFVVIHSDDFVLRYYSHAPVDGSMPNVADASGHIDLKHLDYIRLCATCPTHLEIKEKDCERIPYRFECKSKIEAETWVHSIQFTRESEPTCTLEEMQERASAAALSAKAGSSSVKWDEQHVILEGYLSKRSRGRSLLSKTAGSNRWAERRFCLYYPERVIAYYDGEVCKGSYVLHDHSIVVAVPSSDEDGRHNVFEVQNTKTGELLRCSADSVWRAEKWRQVLMQVISSEYECETSTRDESSQRNAPDRMEAMSDDARAALRDIAEHSPHCADCLAPHPGWASANNGVLVCTQCCGVHRSLGVMVSFVQSLTLDAWRDENVEQLSSRGPNDVANEVLEFHVPPSILKPTQHSSREVRAAYITAKYAHRAFAQVCEAGIQRERLAPVFDTAHAADAKSIGELEFIGILLIKLVSCSNLERADFIGSSDPYVLLTSGQQTVKSKKIANCCKPVFNETLMLSWDGSSPLLVQVMDFDRFKKHDPLGNVTIPLGEADFEGGAVVHIVERALENVSRGKITLEVVFNRL